MKKLLILAVLMTMLPFTSFAADEGIAGTYKLISSTRKILDTGEVQDTYGKQPKGSIIYAKDGHFLVIITHDGRPKPESIKSTTDQQRADLYNTLLAYGGTYTFDGKKVEHKVDLSWNELWNGTTVTRDITNDGNRLVYTTRPAPYSGDGKMSVVTLVWEQIK
jgi:hypothetical protein